MYQLARSRLPAAIETKLATLPSSIIETHGKDIHVSASGTSTPANGTATPPLASTSAAAPARASVPVQKAASKTVNTATVTVEATFQASAQDLFNLLTDEKRIPHWTRNVAVVRILVDPPSATF